MKPMTKRRITSWILTASSFLGTIMTGYLAHRNTKKAMKMLEEMDEHPETWQEEFKLTWQCYIPTYVAGAVTLVSVGMNKHVDHKYIMGLVPATVAPIGLIREYEMKARELLGDEQVERIKDAVAEDHLLDIPKAHPPVITTYEGGFDGWDDVPDTGDVIFYDELFQVSFRNSKDAVRAGIYYFDRNYTLEGYGTVGQLYKFWGAECYTVDDPDRYAWSTEYTLTEYQTPWVDVAVTKSRRKVRLKDGSVVGEEYYMITYPVPPVLEEFANGDRDDWSDAIDETQSMLIKEIDR